MQTQITRPDSKILEHYRQFATPDISDLINRLYTMTAEIKNLTNDFSIAAPACLGLKLAGLDILTRDISIRLSESGGIINEINTTPGLHHHILVAVKEQLVPVTAITVEYILSPGASIRTEQSNRIGQL